MCAAMEHAPLISLIPFFLDSGLEQIKFDPLLLEMKETTSPLLL
jgi:hypothetical protein